MNDADRRKLIDDLLEGDISEADFLRLEAEMIVNEDARHAYYESQKLRTVLELESESSSGAPGTGTPVPIRPRRRLDPVLFGAAAAFALLVGVVGWRIGQDSSGVTARTEPVASGFGVIAEGGSSWSDGVVREKGSLLPAGPLQLSSGPVQVELFSGVDLLLGESADFTIVSPMLVELRSGVLQARVPDPARGFRVRIPSGEVVDLGTEFVAKVTPLTERLQVIDGSVSWRPDDGEERRLEPGDGFELSRDGSIETIRELMPPMSERERVFAAARDHRRERWQIHLSEMRDDPRLLALYVFGRTPAGESGITDLSGAGHDGSIVLAGRAPNRWGDAKAGLDFGPTGSRVRVTIPGESRSLTLMCWVRIDSLDRWYNSLFLTDGHELHEPHWQILDDGRMFFSVKAREAKGTRDKHIAYSPPIWTPAQSGRWMHLATVFDGEAGTTTHFVNGEAVSIDEIPVDFRPEKVRIGAASIGNWSEPRYRDDAEFAVRNLNGTMDEFALFGAALGGAEIREIYEIGKP